MAEEQNTMTMVLLIWGGCKDDLCKSTHQAFKIIDNIGPYIQGRALYRRVIIQRV